MDLQNKSWYKKLNQSPLTPPSWTFGVVWPLLYASLIIYFFLNLYSTSCTGLCDRLIFFLVQLFFNLIWPVTFFQQREIKMGFVYLILMDIFTLITIYYTPDKTKYILYPYMAWISFATYLNGYIAWYN